MSKPPRKHHFVQAEHIRQFRNRAGTVWVYAKDGKQFEMTPEGIFKKKDLNSFEGPEGLDTSFEDYVTQLENIFWPALKRVIDTKTIDPNDIEEITTYLALSRMRNPTVQAGVVEFHRQSVETVTEIMERHGQFDDLGPNPVNPEKSLSESIRDGDIEILINNSVYLQAINRMIVPFQRILAKGYGWGLVGSTMERVLISDHPLTFLHPGEDHLPYGITPGGRTCEVAFPLSKDIYLLGLWEQEVVDVVSEDAVDELNKRQAIFANRHIASSQNSRTWSRLASRFRNHGFQTRAETLPTGDSAYQMVRSGVFPLSGNQAFRGTHPLKKTKSIKRLL